MKAWKRSLLLALALAGGWACSVNSSYLMLRLEALSVPAVKTDDFREMAVADFYIPESAPGINLNQEVTDFFKAEAGSRFRGTVSRRSLILDKEEKLKDEAFWKEAAGGAPGVLVLTGKIRLEQELRKALLNEDIGSRENPFLQKKVLNERKNFTLQATLFLIDGGTGRVLFEKDYKEAANYANTKQPSAFALFDLLQQLKVKFFRTVFGSVRIQERYLLFR
jgi:hypothetical protein